MVVPNRSQRKVLSGLAANGCPVYSGTGGTVDDEINITQWGGVHESAIFETNHGCTGLRIGLALCCRQASRIANYDLKLPWPARIQWLERDLEAPKYMQYRIPDTSENYASECIINHRHQLSPMHPIEGYLLGFSDTPFPKHYKHGLFLAAGLSVYDDLGLIASTEVQLWVCRNGRPMKSKVRRTSLFEGRDMAYFSEGVSDIMEAGSSGTSPAIRQNSM